MKIAMQLPGILTILSSLNLDVFSQRIQCTMSVVESIPEGLTYKNQYFPGISTYDAWMRLLTSANSSVQIAQMYWTLRSKDVFYKDKNVYPSAVKGENVYAQLDKMGRANKVKIQIAQSEPSKYQPAHDTPELSKYENIEVRNLDFKRFEGSGVLHTKFILVDNSSFYMGSANMDWRSLTEVKEMGILVENCPSLAVDLSHVFSTYWVMGEPNSTLPTKWPLTWAAKYSMAEPMKAVVNETDFNVFIASSPPEMCTAGRTDDIAALLEVIDSADKFVYIAVMDYAPTTLYKKPRMFWPEIDDAIKRAAFERNVHVRLLVSKWAHTKKEMAGYMKSLMNFKSSNIDAKFFEVPATADQAKIPFARVNHNKYMVTEKTAYVGTSNWSADYFLWTGGISMIFNHTAANLERSELIHASKARMEVGSKKKFLRERLRDMFCGNEDKFLSSLFCAQPPQTMKLRHEEHAIVMQFQNTVKRVRRMRAKRWLTDVRGFGRVETQGIREQLQQIFLRDWNSDFVLEI